MDDNRIKKEIYETIKELRDDYGLDWEKIEEKGPFVLFKYDNFISEELQKQYWDEMIKEAKDVEENSEKVIIISDEHFNGTNISKKKNSAWKLYKDKLEKKNFDSKTIDNITKDCDAIRKRLCYESGTTTRGLVIGSIQSGKTANMAGLICQAADAGWNMFIVASGMIENLREQTEKRLFKDVCSGDGGCSWTVLNSVTSKKPYDSEKIDNLNLRSPNSKYLCVVLKNKSRLENLIRWLKNGKKQTENLNILFIDDEADSGSINTGDVNSEYDRTRIYSLIEDIVDGKLIDGDKVIGNEKREKIMANSINYVCYTATPYANILNDSKLESLYPKDFICVLTESSKYIGPNRIFGVPKIGKNEEIIDPLNIVETISDEDKAMILDIEKYGFYNLPNSLKEAIAWFICVGAARRKMGEIKPTSMLIHTSIKVDYHNQIYKAVSEWYENNRNNLLEYCRSVYENKKAMLTPNEFKNVCSTYSDESINNYLPFSDIEEEVKQILSGSLANIRLDEADETKFVYSNKQIHICVDNYKNNRISEYGEHLRVAYPKQEEYPGAMFIVIGGSTLSRGLTIEGLVSSYFLRSSKQGDTLMQMGRWFGYRIGYELYPRIWMDQNTREQFEFLSQMDYDLRKDMRKYMDLNKTPMEIGPLIDESPKVSWLGITAKNKKQSAIISSCDFTGVQAQTVVFEENVNVQNENIKKSKEFLLSLGEPEYSYNKVSLVWKNVDINRIIDYLRDFNFHESNSTFNNIDCFKNWLDAANENRDYINEWNVVLAGIENGSKEWELNDKYKVSKVQRTRKQDTNFINIGVLRSYKDNYQDITVEDEMKNKGNMIPRDKMNNTKDNIDPFELKEKYGFEVKPLLVMYVIDGDSKATSRTNKRRDMNFSTDIIGLFMNVPGSKDNKFGDKKLTVKLPKKMEDEVE